MIAPSDTTVCLVCKSKRIVKFLNAYLCKKCGAMIGWKHIYALRKPYDPDVE